MAEFMSGSTMILSWVWSGGTASMNADYQTCKITQTADIKDGTSGADTTKVKLVSFKDCTIDVGLVTQGGGTAVNAALVAGNIGTLTVQPEGTATGKPKY